MVLSYLSQFYVIGLFDKKNRINFWIFDRLCSMKIISHLNSLSMKKTCLLTMIMCDKLILSEEIKVNLCQVLVVAIVCIRSHVLRSIEILFLYFMYNQTYENKSTISSGDMQNSVFLFYRLFSRHVAHAVSTVLHPADCSLKWR